MIKAGSPTDNMINALLPLLDDEDILLMVVIQTIKIQFVEIKH